MPIKTIEFNKQSYPKFQAQGGASKFAIPFALEVCKGVGLDIGYNREEWKYPGAIGVDPAIDKKFDALNLPRFDEVFLEPKDSVALPKSIRLWHYIFSSHCLEHLDDWVEVLNYWETMLVPGGVLFLYLPHYSQTYWRPWANRKHKHIFTPEIIRDYLTDKGWKKIFVSERDLNNSFMAMAEKPL